MDDDSDSDYEVEISVSYHKEDRLSQREIRSSEFGSVPHSEESLDSGDAV